MSTDYTDFFKKVRKKNSKNRQKVQLKPVASKGRRSQPKKQGQFPIIELSMAVVLLGAGLWSLDNLELVESYFRRIRIGAFSDVFAEDGPSTPKSQPKAKANMSKSSGANTASSSSTNNDLEKKANPSKVEWSEAEIAVFNKLEHKKRELDDREQKLVELESDLHKREVEIEKRLKELDVLRSQISTHLDDRVKADKERVEKLVEFYSNMKPQSAAQVFEKIDEALAVEILEKMKKKSAADIMNLIGTDKAQRLSEKLAGYMRK
ncbi:MAG: hypothetical protein COT74_09180 [Bdellovibrionales bacterium CG10_big_fil_rev_8_21_14_0_10_45_34]|nr:MAG: hypothetical protein COT74_09180 [Bdellovibrionales bacterium CG10_big_fil_rev_8_21_14_0_10_45_34]